MIGSWSRIVALFLAAAGIALALRLVPPLRSDARRAAAVLALLAIGAAICLTAAAAPRFAARTWVRYAAVAAGALTCGLAYALRHFVALDTLPSVPLSDTSLRTELAEWCRALDAVTLAAAYLTASFLVVPTSPARRPGSAPASHSAAATAAEVVAGGGHPPTGRGESSK